MAGWTVPGYTETRVLGTEGTGRVVEALHDASGDRVSITYLDARLWSDEGFRERVRADTELLADVEHPNVVRVREVVEPGSETGPGVTTGAGAAVVTEAVDGAALRRVLATSGPLSPEAALAVMRGALLGLGAAGEAGVVHRDYQPSTVLITVDGVVRVTGFGMAARTEAMMPAPGTPAYMAPELWEGATPRSVTDVYAVTATFYECLTGRVPYSADSVFELQTLHRAAPIPVGDVPAALGPLLAQGLAKTPVERPADAAGFIAEVEAAAAVEFGLKWEERGRRELAALVAGLAEAERSAEDQGLAAFTEAPTSVLPVVAAVDETAGSDVAADGADGAAYGSQSIRYGGSEGMGRGTKTGLAVAAVAVIGAVVAAVAFAPGKHATAATGPSGETVSTPSETGSSGDDGTAPGIAAGGAPTRGSHSSGTSSPAKAPATGPTSATSATSATSGTTLTSIGLPVVSLSPTAPFPSYPPPSPPPSTLPTTPIGSSGSSTPPSATVTISASASMTTSTYSGPCPPTDPPTGTVTFTVGGLPAGGTVPITYQWHVTGSTTSGTTGGSGTPVVFDAQDGSTTQQFTIVVDPHSQKGLSGTVEIAWSAPGTPGGTTTAGTVDITCTPGGGASSGGGPTSTGTT